MESLTISEIEARMEEAMIAPAHTRAMPTTRAADVAAVLRRLKAERDPLYREVATIRIDTDHKHSGRVAAELAAALGWDEEARA